MFVESKAQMSVFRHDNPWYSTMGAKCTVME